MKLKRKFGIVFYIIPTLVFIALLAFEINYANKKLQADSVSYNEKSDIAYKVYLKDNEYFDTPYLEDDSSFIASLVDNFTINYTYLNTFSDDVDYTLNYNVKAELVVYDANNDKKPVYTRKYTLVEDKKVSNKGRVAKVDLLNQVINYDEYNKIINDLKREVIPEANLIISFNTKFKGKSDLVEKDIVSNKTSTLKIPISQKTINVESTKNNLSETNTVTGEKKLNTKLLIIIIVTCLLILISAIRYIIYVITTAKKRSKYEQKVSKILREFDRAITEANGEFKVEKNNNLIEIKDFMELLDVHDNLNIPIIYYKYNNDKSLFVVKHNDDIYYNVIKKEDFED